MYFMHLALDFLIDLLFDRVPLDIANTLVRIGQDHSSLLQIVLQNQFSI